MTTPLIEGRTGEWEVVIGLEVHAQIVAKAKLFSGAATDFGAEPNTQVSTVDAAFPGMLPVINRHCVEQAVKTGLGIDAEINLHTVFDRKNYFYPDLPAGYQISQYQQPVVGRGRVVLDMPDGSTREIGITRLHLEQDAGKSLHDQHPSETYVDLNRAGVGLMEIVSEPDLRSAEEAGIYLRKLRSILRYLGTCDGNMEEGRCAATATSRCAGPARRSARAARSRTSTRCASSCRRSRSRRAARSRSSRTAARSRRRRGSSMPGAARPGRCARRSMRTTTAISPIPTCCRWCSTRPGSPGCAPSCPNCPTRRRRASSPTTGCPPDDADVLVAERATAEFFETAAQGRDPKAAANWVMGDLFGALNKQGLGIEDSPVAAAQLGGLIDLIADGTISGRIAKDVFAEMVETGADAAAIVEAKGLRQVTDTGAIEAAVDAALAASPAQVAQYAANPKVLGFFVGQVMKATQGKANPALVNELLQKKLGGGVAAIEEAGEALQCRVRIPDEIVSSLRSLAMTTHERTGANPLPLLEPAGISPANCGSARRSPCRSRRRIRRGCRSPCSGCRPAARRRHACG